MVLCTPLLFYKEEAMQLGMVALSNILKSLVARAPLPYSRY